MISIYLIKNIYKKIYLSPSIIFLFFLSFISGLFKEIIIFFIVIFIHEIGHIITSLIFNWNIKKITFGVCGGFIIYDDYIDKPFIEEFLISISGLIFQSIFFFICILFYKISLLDKGLMVLIEKYHYSIFLFNILPIIPLDGSKLIMVILSYITPYKNALEKTKIISFFMVFLIIFVFFFYNIKLEYNYIMIFFFLISKIINYAKDIPHLFNRFLLERYLTPKRYHKKSLIKGNNLSKVRRQYNHYFLINNHCYKEKDILSKRFD